MDHFQHSQAVRQQILADRPLIKKLEAHFLEGRKLDTVIGFGTNNIHYRAGALPGGLWVATREQFREHIPFGDQARSDSRKARLRETGNHRALEFSLYCKEAYCWSESFGFIPGVTAFSENGGTGYVTSFTIAVRYQPAWRDRPFYALLLEDLTAGGSVSLSKLPEDDSVAYTGTGKGPIRIDLDDHLRHAKKHRGVPDYLAEEAIIDLGRA